MRLFALEITMSESNELRNDSGKSFQAARLIFLIVGLAAFTIIGLVTFGVV